MRIRYSRFSLRTLLLMTAAICVFLYLVHDYTSLESAREEYSTAEKVWLAGIATTEEVIVQSEILAVVEAESIWISGRKANASHKKRMNTISKIEETRSLYKSR